MQPITINAIIVTIAKQVRNAFLNFLFVSDIVRSKNVRYGLCIRLQ